jgi:hypothetical protein
VIFPTYELDCKNTAASFGAHHIDLPLPAQLTLGGAPPSRDHIKNVAFICPLCEHVHRYDGSDLRHRVNQVDLERMPPVPVPVRITILCRHAGCGVAVTVYTTRKPSEKRPDVVVRLRRAVFHVRCENGHIVDFACDQAYELNDGPLSNPF